MNITQEGEEQVTWINPISKEKEIVIKGSTKDIEYTKRLNDAGLYAENDPNKPEGCLTSEEFEEYLKKDKESRLKRMEELLKDADGR